MIRHLVFLLAAVQLVAFFSAHVAHAQSIEEEGLGRLALSDLFLEPTYTYTEPRRGNFGLGNSYVAATWKRDRIISATMKLGTKSMLGLPARYGVAPTTDVGLVEAFGEADTDYGRVRFGLVPIPFGLEGGDAERRLRFPRSLVFQARYMNIRDYGVSYRIAHGGFFTEWVIHNGEGANDLDNELWFTSRWGWQGLRFLRVGISGSAGRTSPKSTNPTGSGVPIGWTAPLDGAPGLEIEKISKIGIINGFAQWDVHPVRISLETTAGDTRQDDNVIKFRELHADVEVEGGSSSVWLGRYDTMDPRNDKPGDQVTDLTLGLGWKSRYENSVFYVLGTKRIQQDASSDMHQVMAIWRLTPTATTLQSAL